MVDEKVILQVLAEQQEYVQSYEPQKWVGRYEENLFELDSPLSIKKYLRILFYIASCIYEAYSCPLWEAATTFMSNMHFSKV